MTLNSEKVLCVNALVSCLPLSVLKLKKITTSFFSILPMGFIDLSTLINECKRVLKKNGYIVLSTPNYYSLWPILEIILNFLSPVNYKHQHINKFNKKKLLKFIKKKGFNVSEINSFMLISPFLAIISFKLSLHMLKFDNFFTRFFPGFLLFLKGKKV